MLGDVKSGGMTIEQLVDTVSDVYKMSYGSIGDVIQFHKGAQLLIVTGTNDELQFVQQTLAALSRKAQLEQKLQPTAVETKSNPDEKKPR
jgi:hypothetical protein